MPARTRRAACGAVLLGNRNPVCLAYERLDSTPAHAIVDQFLRRHLYSVIRPDEVTQPAIERLLCWPRVWKRIP